MPGSVTVAHQNLGLSVKVRILAGQWFSLFGETKQGLIPAYNLRSLAALIP